MIIGAFDQSSDDAWINVNVHGSFQQDLGERLYDMECLSTVF
jgi:hypothetical protein